MQTLFLQSRWRWRWMQTSFQQTPVSSKWLLKWCLHWCVSENIENGGKQAASVHFQRFPFWCNFWEYDRLFWSEIISWIFIFLQPGIRMFPIYWWRAPSCFKTLRNPSIVYCPIGSYTCQKTCNSTSDKNTMTSKSLSIMPYSISTVQIDISTVVHKHHTARKRVAHVFYYFLVTFFY